MFLRRFASTASTSRRLSPTIQQLLSCNSLNENHAVSITGFVRSVRRQKRVAFAAVNDGSSPDGLQAVLGPETAKILTNGCSVRLTGKLVKSLGCGQEKELIVDECEVMGSCDPETYPIQKQSLSVEHLRDNVHLRARTDTISSMLRVRDQSIKSFNDFFNEEGFIYINPPILTGNDCEGAGEAFRISPVVHRTSSSTQQSEFFDRPAYLTVSSQLHLESMVQALTRVYTISPCFRAERSQTNRHLSEFWMLEAEWGFTKSVDEVCGIVEGSIKQLLERQLGSKDMQVLWKEGDEQRRRSVEEAATRSWTRMAYNDAIKELVKNKAEFEFDPKWGKALQSEHERWLADKVVGGPVFVTNYPTTLKPFYMRVNEDLETVACFDLLMPYLGELVGGSLREERVEFLDGALDKSGLDREDYRWYTDLRTFGGAPHGGFGLGLERLISWMTGVENVRECIPVPRWPGRLLL